MIRLGLRMTMACGREGTVRLVVTIGAMALGVGMLLITLAGINAVNAQDARFAWLTTGIGDTTSSTSATTSHGAAHDPAWWRLGADYFHGQRIGVVDVAATGPNPPVPPGIPKLPGPGEFYASPAMSTLLRATPATQLADRYPGRQIGTIGHAGLASPDMLLIVVGVTPNELAHDPDAHRIVRIATTSPASCSGETCAVGVGVNANGIALVLAVVGCALMFPLLTFIGTATRLSAARREQRFAAMRLAGATPRQVSTIAAIESGVAACAGTVLGFGVFVLLRPTAARIPFTGMRFFVDDLSLSAGDAALAALGVPIAAMVVAWLSLRRVQVSPLGVSRRVTPRPLRAYRLIPLCAGIAELVGVLAVGAPSTTGRQTAAFLPGFLLVLAGLVTAGPWLTMVGSRALARRANRPAALIAARRLADNPRAGFRAISGLIVALLVTTVGVGTIATLDDERGVPRGVISSDILLAQVGGGVPDEGVTVPSGLLSVLRMLPGVSSVVEIHVAAPHTMVDGGGNISEPGGIVTCSELARAPELGRCRAGATTAEIPAEGFAFWLQRGDPPQADLMWQSAGTSPAHVARLATHALLVVTDGSTSAVERARTVLENAYPDMTAPSTRADSYVGSDLDLWQRLADVVIIASLVIAGCTLAVSAIAGLVERKRPFSMLRLTGVRLAVLRRVVGLETAMPLLTAAVVAIGIGFLSTQLFLEAQLGYRLHAPGVEYWALVVAGVIASLAIVALTLPVLERLTGPETARND